MVIPAFDEAESLPSLLPRVGRSLARIEGSHEVIVVDDGSKDGTAAAVEALGLEWVRVVRLRVNRGKSEALRVGLGLTSGSVVALIDADGQDEPDEIPTLVAALDAHDVDLVTGRRATRNDRAAKRVPSRLYNAATARVTGVAGRDFNSGLKVMRSEVAESLDLYGELHRYIPVLASWAGFRTTELDVVHHPRQAGRSKFGRERFWRGFLDLVTVKFLTTYTARPFHLFGGLASILAVAGGSLLGWMLALRLAGERVGDRPALIAGVLLVVVAVQLASLGLMAELMVHLRRREHVERSAGAGARGGVATRAGTISGTAGGGTP